MASDMGGAADIIAGYSIIIISNITCIGNRSPRGGCLYLQEVTLIVKHGNISENFGHQYAAGIVAEYSRIQVGAYLDNETSPLLLL